MLYIKAKDSALRGESQKLLCTTGSVGYISRLQTAFFLYALNRIQEEIAPMLFR